MEPKTALRLIEEEYIRSRIRFPVYRSPHEGLAILREEYKELEREVFEHKPSPDRSSCMLKESMHVAAMALAFMVESCEPPKR